MIEIAKNTDGVGFYLLEHPSELDKLEVGEFIYFKKHLGMSDYMANFKSWLRRPTVYLVVAIMNNSIIGWSMNESWSKPSSDGRPVFVLRAIEISPQLSSRGLGRTLFTLVSRVLPGHIITKPVNANAKKFFASLSFHQPANNSPVDLADHPGYMMLGESEKSALSLDRMALVHDRTESCRMKKFPKENLAAKKAIISAPASSVMGENAGKDAKLQGIGTVDNVGKEDSNRSENRNRSEDRVPKESAGAAPSASAEKDPRGEFIGNQKMLSSCECGENMACKFLQSGPRSGTAFICASCGRERYFLPLRKVA